jgi:hypothetical protein
LSIDNGPFAAVTPAWVSLAELPEIIERRLGVPAAEAADILRPLLEDYKVRTVVVGWNRDRAARSGASNLVAQGHPGDPYPYCVYKQGWEHIDWKAGALAGCEVRVRWSDVTEQLENRKASQRSDTPSVQLPDAGSASLGKAEASSLDAGIHAGTQPCPQ